MIKPVIRVLSWLGCEAVQGNGGRGSPSATLWRRCQLIIICKRCFGGLYICVYARFAWFDDSFRHSSPIFTPWRHSSLSFWKQGNTGSGTYIITELNSQQGPAGPTVTYWTVLDNRGSSRTLTSRFIPRFTEISVPGTSVVEPDFFAGAGEKAPTPGSCCAA